MAYKMRLSEWSSVVCSSDLDAAACGPGGGEPHQGDGATGHCRAARAAGRAYRIDAGWKAAGRARFYLAQPGGRADRKSVVSGKRVSVRVDIGGRRIIKKNSILR